MPSSSRWEKTEALSDAKRPTEEFPDHLRLGRGHRTVGPYRLLRQVGRGGMGIVYRAYDPRLDRDVALKFLPPEACTASAAETRPAESETVRRFLAEAKAASALDHPNICTVYDVGETEDGQLYIAMAYYEGETLAERIARAPIGVGEAVEIALQVADGLARAHAAGIVHRDVKPANLMLSDGLDERPRTDRVKILDFGIAKLEGGTLTRPGSTPGTLAYMSPEQLEGAPADPRSDLWSLGVVLYEMLAGEPPFRGRRGALVRAILGEPPRSLRSLRGDVPPALERIVQKALAKHPDERYSGAAELVRELEPLRREIESVPVSGVSAASAVPLLRRRRLAAAAALALVLLAGAWQARRFLRPEAPGAPAPAADPVERPRASVAVLYFENLSGDADLDWLRYGLTDMLVTDLSQSPELSVLGTDRLYQILTDLGRLDDRAFTSDLVRDVARQSRADTVVLGSFARLGDTIRIAVRIREAASGEITASEKVDASSETELLARVDELSRNIRLGLELPLRPETVADLDLDEVTTSSLEAYRYYVEGARLLRLDRAAEAIARLERAVAVDSGFAMAWIRLSDAHRRLWHYDAARESARRALAHAARLSGPERAVAEGRYYSESLMTCARALEIYRRALELYPHQDFLRAELVRTLDRLEMHAELIEHLELLRAKEAIADVRLFHSLADAYVSRGEVERGYRILAEARRRFPESAFTYTGLALQQLRGGHLDEAEATLVQADAMSPESYGGLGVAWHLHVLREEWEKAERTGERIGRLVDPGAPKTRLLMRIWLELHHGRGAEVEALFDRAIDVYSQAGVDRADVHMTAAYSLLGVGRVASALSHARAARAEGSGDLPAWLGLGIEALAQQALGREREADRSLAELSESTASIPGTSIKSYPHEIRGRLAAARGDLVRAVAELEIAAELTPVVGLEHTRVVYHLAVARLEAAQHDRAAEHFRRIVEPDFYDAQLPLVYARSLYFLGRIHEERGDAELARGYYRRFVDRWGGGDLDRDRVNHARRWLERA